MIQILIGVVVFYLAWRGITTFCVYWAEQEQRRMPPQTPGLKSDHRRVG